MITIRLLSSAIDTLAWVLLGEIHIFFTKKRADWLSLRTILISLQLITTVLFSYDLFIPPFTAILLLTFRSMPIFFAMMLAIKYF